MLRPRLVPSLTVPAVVVIVTDSLAEASFDAFFKVRFKKPFAVSEAVANPDTAASAVAPEAPINSVEKAELATKLEEARAPIVIVISAVCAVPDPPAVVSGVTIRVYV
jgi:hypothetical protein